MQIITELHVIVVVFFINKSYFIFLGVTSLYVILHQLTAMVVFFFFLVTMHNQGEYFVFL